MWIINPITEQILRDFEQHLELLDPVPIGFTGVANQEVTPVYSNEVDAPTLTFGFFVDFAPGSSKVWIRSTNPQYEWNATANTGTPNYMPVAAVAGVVGQVLPVLPLVMPFLLQPSGKIEFRFINSATSPITGGNIAIRRLKLIGRR